MRRKSWYIFSSSVILTPIAIYGLFVVALFFKQESMIFPGTTLPCNHQFKFDVPFQELTIPVDGAELSGLHFKQPDPRGLIFFLHGNGGNLESWTSGADYYQRVNYDMFMFDYRGYGKSTGTIRTEAQLHDDVSRAWKVITPHYDGKPIVVYGRSLGTALAVELAKNVRPELLVLVSPFTSVVAMAQNQYPFVPAWLVRYPLRTKEIMGEVRSPTIFVHGDRDTLIPITHSYELAKLTRSPSKMLVIEGAGHNNIHRFESYLDGLTAELPN